MRKIWILLCLLLVSTVAAVVLPAAAMTLDEALAIFHGDDVGVPYSAEGKVQLEAAIEAFRVAIGVPATLDEKSEDRVGEFAVDMANKTILNKLSQCYYTLADIFFPWGDAQKDLYLKGKAWGFKSLRMNPQFLELETKGGGFIKAVEAETDVPALYWANANWLRTSEYDKGAAVMGSVPAKSEAITLRTLELAPSYICYGSYRSLGAFWGGLPDLNLPRFGLLAYQQDLTKALPYFCCVVNEPALCTTCTKCTTCPIDPSVTEYFENRYFFAEFYLVEKKLWADAKRVLESIIADPIGDKYPLYNGVDQEKARTLLIEVNAELATK